MSGWEALGPLPGQELESDNDGLAEAVDNYPWFSQTDILRGIRQWAYSNRVSPWAALVAVLARFSSDIPPGVVLPGLGGGPVGSLNTYGVLVGPPGAGKSALMQSLDTRFMPRTENPEEEISKMFSPGSSGEGIAARYVTSKTEKGVVTHERIAFQAFGYIDEIGMLEDTAGRQGNTTLAVLRQMWTGAFYENSVATKERERRLDAHTYRLSVLMGAQPGVGELLFDKTARITGFTHRLIFAEVRDPFRKAGDSYPGPPPAFIPVIHPQVPFPSQRRRQLGPHVGGHALQRFELHVDPTIHDFMVAEEDRARAGEAGAIAGHRMFLQLRIAAVLAIMHGEAGVSTAWFDMADAVMEQSDAGLEVMRRAHHESLRQEKLAAASEQGELQLVTERARSNGMVPKALDVARLHRERNAHPDGWCTKKCFRDKFRRNRDELDDVLAEAVRRGQLMETTAATPQAGREVQKWRLP